MKKIYLYFILLVLPATLNAKVDYTYVEFKEAYQRGYTMDGDSVVFPDSSKCLYKDFVKGTCGSKWLTSDNCIGEGKVLENDKKCCEGLAPYLQDGGQKTCEKIDKIKNVERYQSKMVWFALIFPVLLILIALLTWVMRRRAKKSQNL